MLDIARHGKDAPVRAQDISLRQNLSIKYAEQITTILAKAGLLNSARGAGGGYSLVKKPEEYKASEILFKTEGDLVLARCAAVDGRCDREESCAVKTLWTGLHKVMVDYLDSVTLQDLLDSVYHYNI